MKVLKANQDFISLSELNLSIGQEVLIKSSIATGWASLCKVVRETKCQIEVEVINIIPTEESNRFGIKNGLKDRGTNGGFFENWAFRKKCSIGRRSKFWKDSAIRVGDSENWNPSVICEIL